MKKTGVLLIRERDNGEKSARWYRDMLHKVGLYTTNPMKAFHMGLGTPASSILIGAMYLYLYDPKTKDTLPYYDTAPLVVVFGSAPGGFVGLNLHYLSPVLRYNLLLRLMELVRSTNINSNTRMQLSWSVLRNSSRYPGADVCVKRYLYSHIKSRILRIDARDWKTAVMLPIENFVRATRLSVFNRSRRSIK
jgi:hypothetical protein